MAASLSISARLDHHRVRGTSPWVSPTYARQGRRHLFDHIIQRGAALLNQ